MLFMSSSAKIQLLCEQTKNANLILLLFANNGTLLAAVCSERGGQPKEKRISNKTMLTGPNLHYAYV